MTCPDYIRDDLLSLAAETACEAVRARDAALRLLKAADGASSGLVESDSAIRQAAKALGIPIRHRQTRHVMTNLAEVLLEDVSNPGTQASKVALAFAAERDLRAWERAGIVPAGAYHESARSVAIARESGGQEDARVQLLRCKLALAYPAILAFHIADAAVRGDAAPTLGAYAHPPVVELSREVCETLA